MDPFDVDIDFFKFVLKLSHVSRYILPTETK